MKYRATIIVVFAVLTALAIAGGVYLGIRTRNQYQDFLDRRDNLRKDIAQIQSDISEFKGDIDDTLSMKHTVDSLMSVMQVTRLNYQEIMTSRGSLMRTPRVSFADSVVTDSWVEHPFVMTIEGKPEAIDSFLATTQTSLPSMRVDTLKGELKGFSFRVNASGSVRFPLD